MVKAGRPVLRVVGLNSRSKGRSGPLVQECSLAVVQLGGLGLVKAGRPVLQRVVGLGRHLRRRALAEVLVLGRLFHLLALTLLLDSVRRLV